MSCSFLPGRRLAMAVGFAAAALTAAPLMAESRVVPRPGMAYTPAFVCLASETTPRGDLANTRVIRRSGNARSDRMAKRFVSNLRLGLSSRPGENAPPDMATLYALVRMHSTGQLAYQLFWREAELPEICREDHVSVERDKAINAATEM